MNDIALLTRIEKAARDCGFDIKNANVNKWQFFSSSHCPLKVWLFIDDTMNIYVAISQINIRDHISNLGQASAIEAPPEAQYAISVTNINSLHLLLKRAFQLSRSLPSEPLHEYKRLTSKLPDKTEEERIVKQRIGQDIFRKSLFDYWDGQCAVTGFAVPQLLKASHIKPWADCDKDEDRLCVFNGLLLSPQYDAAFDNGLISFENCGSIIISPNFPREEYPKIGISDSIRIFNIDQRHYCYLEWHRKKVFKE